jgi:ATP-binding protein involved in chromosome partitioning
MPTLEDIQQALTQVIDPELGGNIVELGMARDIKITDGHVDITLALTIAGCPLRNQLQEQTRNAALSVPGVQSAEVELTTMTDQQRNQLKDRLPPALNLNQIGRMVAVMSGKGGVGKSSVTALMATALKRQGYQVGILDADLTGPSIPRLFGISGPVRGIPMGILPVETRTGIRVISTNLMLAEEDMAIIWRGPVMSNTIRQFWSDVLWGRLDYLLVDLPPGTSDATLTALQSFPLDGVVFVTMPQGLSSMIVRKTVHMALDLEIPILGIVENMSFILSPETGTRLEVFGPSHSEAIAKAANAPILGRLPIDPDLTQLADAGEIEQYEHAAYAELAAAFIAAAPPVEPRPAATMVTQPPIGSQAGPN